MAENAAAYVQVVKVGSKYVYEARDSSHNVVAKSKQFRSEAEAMQAGADAYSHQYHPTEMTTGQNPHTGEVETSPAVVSLGLPVRRAVVNDGEAEE